MTQKHRDIVFCTIAVTALVALVMFMYSLTTNVPLSLVEGNKVIYVKDLPYKCYTAISEPDTVGFSNGKTCTWSCNETD